MYCSDSENVTFCMTENICQLPDIKTWYYLLYLPGIIIIPGISPVELTKNMA